VLLQTSHLRLNVRDAACSIVFTCTSNRRHINLNICFASVTPYETGLMGHPIYVICGIVRPLNFSCFWVRFSIEFPALLTRFQRTRGTDRVHDLLKGNRYESTEKNTRQTCVEKKALTNKSSRYHLHLVTCCGRSGAIKSVRSVMRMCRHFYLTATKKKYAPQEKSFGSQEISPDIVDFGQIKLPDRSYS